mmetsp:Transcript_45592/g.85092  ORF Transcript_45592/g.85092 Transcript_45592/m.85092 type:complete len:359 (-) Transcript_45592:142-1218(-)
MEAASAQVSVVPQAPQEDAAAETDRRLPVDPESGLPEPQVRFQLPGSPSTSSGWIKGAWSEGDRSLWRYPSKPGSVPEYMRRAFRVKTFSLMTLQLAVVFAEMVSIDHYQLWYNVLTEMREGHFIDVGQEVLFYSCGFCTLISIMVMFCFKDRYPANYWLIVTTTLLSGFFWGMTRAVVQTTMHFQIVGIICCAMAGGAVASSVIREVDGPKFLIATLAPGWLVGATVNVLISRVMIQETDRVVLGSTGLSMLLLCILSMDAGRYLILCRPDDFMKVIVAMNSTLMVVVSIPFFVLSFCFIHTGEAVIDDDIDSSLEVSRSTVDRHGRVEPLAAPQSEPVAQAPQQSASEPMPTVFSL